MLEKDLVPPKGPPTSLGLISIRDGKSPAEALPLSVDGCNGPT